MPRTQSREQRLNTPPTWMSSFKRAILAAALMFAFILVTNKKSKDPILAALVFGFLALAIYVPAGYYLGDVPVSTPPAAQDGGQMSDAGSPKVDVRMFTVGPVQENCFIVRAQDSDRAVIVDPGDEAERLLEAIAALGVSIEAILLTHTHFDHVGAGGAPGQGDRRAGVLPRARDRRAGQTSWTSCRGPGSALRELRRGPHGQGRRDAGARPD